MICTCIQLLHRSCCTCEYHFNNTKRYVTGIVTILLSAASSAAYQYLLVAKTAGKLLGAPCSQVG
jgi:hypothetical protein